MLTLSITSLPEVAECRFVRVPLSLGVGFQCIFLCDRCAAESHRALRCVIERARGA